MGIAERPLRLPRLIGTPPNLPWIGSQRWREDVERWSLRDAVAGITNDIWFGGGCRLWAPADAGHIIGDTPTFPSGTILWTLGIS
ncbi:hypothetical protein GCM10007880_66890 [Mesorhizobium amorphae]|nr:hypothetical protein GCM10007880_66890 [Mesorhizobium amorphae]